MRVGYICHQMSCCCCWLYASSGLQSWALHYLCDFQFYTNSRSERAAVEEGFRMAFANPSKCSNNTAAGMAIACVP